MPPASPRPVPPRAPPRRGGRRGRRRASRVALAAPASSGAVDASPVSRSSVAITRSAATDQPPARASGVAEDCSLGSSSGRTTPPRPRRTRGSAAHSARRRARGTSTAARRAARAAAPSSHQSHAGVPASSATSPCARSVGVGDGLGLGVGVTVSVGVGSCVTVSVGAGSGVAVAVAVTVSVGCSGWVSAPAPRSWAPAPRSSARAPRSSAPGCGPGASARRGSAVPSRTGWRSTPRGPRPCRTGSPWAGSPRLPCRRPARRPRPGWSPP